ncbi:hypothetical protein FRB94_005161 [Tulasnella sp. JGI-2019a]|nr:hypothetical protein FRB93_004877 [Tulasnella sp. JGI-2019a]KAG9000781.1 hypothetical protein FRB94_005161 [Tulasnella sp. JGI-2019a]
MASTLHRSAHPALFVDEIIVEFLGHLHQPDSGIDDTNINAAGLTCKAWRDPSLTVKWREVDLKCLFSVLAPLHNPPFYYWHFTRVPTDSDHHRFHDVARRVHSLEDRGDLELGETVFDTIYNGLPASTVLLPNLRSARISAHIRTRCRFVVATRLLPLFPSSLSQLALSIGPNRDESRAILVHDLVSRFSSLSSIKVHWAAETQTEVDAMVKLLEHNSDLRHVTIYHSTGSATTEALSKLPHLESLEIGTSGVSESLNYSGRLRLGPFAQLKSLTIRFPLDATAFALLDNIGAHHSLQTLRMVSPPKESDLDATVDAVVKHPLLRNLSFRQLLVPTTRTVALQVIATCTMLESLEINILVTSNTLTGQPPAHPSSMKS